MDARELLCEKALYGEPDTYFVNGERVAKDTYEKVASLQAEVENQQTWIDANEETAMFRKRALEAEAEVETLRQTLAATRNVFWARSIQLELLKMDCARLLQWVRNPKYPEDVSRWVRTNVESALLRAEIPVTEDAAVKRRLRYEQESHDVQP